MAGDRSRTSIPWIVAGILFLVALTLGVLWNKEATRATDLTTEVTKLTEALAAKTAEAEKLHADTQTLQARTEQLGQTVAAETQEVQAKEALLNTPEVPVTVSYRQAFAGPGLVAVFRNTSLKTLSVLATFFNPTTGQQRSSQLTITPQGVAEIGHAEGWAFASGDKITLKGADYREVSAQVP